jgi:hypothetical protein
MLAPVITANKNDGIIWVTTVVVIGTDCITIIL